jgi:hypothetical protein
MDAFCKLCLYGVWRKGAAVFVDVELDVDGWECALGAIGAFAGLAAHADWGGERPVIQVKPVGVHESMSVAQLTTETYRKCLRGQAVPGALACDGA